MRGGGRGDAAVGVGGGEHAADGEAGGGVDLQPSLPGVEAQRHGREHAGDGDGVEQSGRLAGAGGQLGPGRVRAAGLLRIAHGPQRLGRGAEVDAADPAGPVLAGADHEHVPVQGERGPRHLGGLAEAVGEVVHAGEVVGHVHEARPVGREREHVLGRGADLLHAGLGGDELGGPVAAAHEHGPLPVRGGVDGVALAQGRERGRGGVLEGVRAGGEHGRDGEREGDGERETRCEHPPRPGTQAAREQGEHECADPGPGQHPGGEAQRPEQEVVAEQGADAGEREQDHREAEHRRGVGLVLGR